MEKSVVKDRGFAWIICLACVLVAAIGDGVGSSIGVLTPQIRELMKSKSGSTALAESLHIGLPYSMAPLIVMVVKKVGFRLTSVFGGVIFSASLFICGYLTTIPSLTLVYGVIAGMGMGFMVNGAVCYKCVLR